MAITESKYNTTKWALLVTGIVFDLVGVLTYIVPGLGEWFDLVWAPIAGFSYMIMYKGFWGIIGGTFTFAEELLPMTDVIPSFTITWLLRYVILESRTRKKMGLQTTQN